MADVRTIFRYLLDHIEENPEIVAQLAILFADWMVEAMRKGTSD